VTPAAQQCRGVIKDIAAAAAAAQIQIANIFVFMEPFLVKFTFITLNK
jgi:hypothetical protein